MAEKQKRRRRDPAATREVILEAARTLLAKDGPEGVSLSEVAHLAGVNRGTAYQHFETREKLIQATADWVSDKLFRAVFGDPATIGERRVEEVDVAELTDRLSDFAMENPELCRVWLLQVLAMPDPSEDRFWREYSGSLGRFAATDLAEPDVDAEVLSIMNLAGAFLWPVWARAHEEDARARSVSARRFANECLRLSMYGSMRAHCFPKVAERVGKPQSSRGRDASAENAGQ
ncbi:MAG: TetR/AcrR family transcriptional regulator [Novosphingobium sp.]|nr:TetR/AcrR family transcriptional regulator [Novosphingobium sp.]